VTPDVQEIRWKHYENKRLEKLAMVREERENLINMGWNPTTTRATTATSDAVKQVGFSPEFHSLAGSPGTEGQH
jgi:hypothetical protein